MRRDWCRRCGHRWYRRKPRKPVQCPKCKSALWSKKPVEISV